MTRTPLRTAAAGLCVLALALSGCGDDDSDDGAATDTEATTTTEAGTEATDELEITDVWARRSPAATTMGAVYLTVTSPVDDRLVGVSVSTDVAGTAEIHETVPADEAEGDMDGMEGSDDGMEGSGDGMATTTTAMGGEMGDDAGDDMGTTTTAMGGEMGDDMGAMTMRPVEAIDLPAGEAVALEPGGLHIMLIDLVEPLEVGDEVDLTLTFEEAGEQPVTAEVREG